MITLPIYDMVILPGVNFYFKKEILQKMHIATANTEEDVMFLMLRTEQERDKMKPDDFYPIGITGKIESIDDEGNISVKVKDRVDISDIEVTSEQISVTASTRPGKADISEDEVIDKLDQIRDRMLQFAQGFQWGVWAKGFILHWKSINEIVCAMSGYFNLANDEKYAILEVDSERQRIELIEKVIYEFIEMSKIRDEAVTAQKETHEQVYRESAIKKQIDFLQKQLDEMHPENVSDVRKFENRLNASGMNPEARKEADKVLNRMKQEGKNSHEYGILYDYMDFITSLSWKKEDAVDVNLSEAEEILNEQHYGLKKAKDRIIQQMAVMGLNKKQSGSILLFVGAPGTGKTSIGQSIAKALHREYVRISLGGIRDEAEIRGHRRTYVGAMPGRLMEGVKRSGTSNPVIVLDEVDKLSKDYSGDPASALLEVLDPEQNSNFTDHYMNVPYDLSDVLFVCTANSIDTIPEPLLNRMEVIPFPGYTAIEKFQIAKKHLIPKTLMNMGIKAQHLKITDDALRKIIDDYTMEAGVRGLKKQIDNLSRYAAVKLVKGEHKSITVNEKKVSEYLGRKAMRHESILEKKMPGVVTGLAWTRAGGDILFIETSLSKGTGKVVITGQLGDVMKESAQIAISLVKSMFPKEAEILAESDLHIHVPSGAVPKDGPSAGITLVTALSSLVMGKTVSPEYAMTGEVSLRGKIMPIGGLPEKLMAAQRAGIRKVFIPFDNVDDLEEVAKEVKDKLEIIPVKEVREVLKQVVK
ncbi:MAG: endopeptidase La [Firmicutes bacterium]|nr:endopeptidase La [Bacillota bacterium]